MSGTPTLPAQPIAMWHDRIKAEHPQSEPAYWPSALKVKYMEAEILGLRAALASGATQPSEPGADRWEARHQLDVAAQAAHEGWWNSKDMDRHFDLTTKNQSNASWCEATRRAALATPPTGEPLTAPSEAGPMHTSVTVYPGDYPTNAGGWNIHMKGHGCVAQMPGMSVNPEARAAQERYRDLIVVALAATAAPRPAKWLRCDFCHQLGCAAAAPTESEPTDDEIISLARIASASNNYEGGRFVSGNFNREDLIAFARGLLVRASLPPHPTGGKQ